MNNDAHPLRLPLAKKPTRTTLLSAAIALLLCSVLGPGQASAQATAYTASRTADLQVGGGLAYASPDYGPRIFGFSGYATYDFKTHFGIEAAFHQVNQHDGSQVYERTYEVGGRYVLHYNRFNPFVRVMYGRGVFNFADNAANLAYNIGAVGAGVDYNLRPHINIRGDYEYQQWFGFPPHGLQPRVATVGVAYHF